MPDGSVQWDGSDEAFATIKAIVAKPSGGAGGETRFKRGDWLCWDAAGWWVKRGQAEEVST